MKNKSLLSPPELFFPRESFYSWDGPVLCCRNGLQLWEVGCLGKCRILNQIRDWSMWIKTCYQRLFHSMNAKHECMIVWNSRLATYLLDSAIKLGDPTNQLWILQTSISVKSPITRSYGSICVHLQFYILRLNSDSPGESRYSASSPLRRKFAPVVFVKKRTKI